jgi:transposase
MQQLTVDPKNIFYRRNAVYGYMEAVDAVSGEVLAVQKDYNENFILGKMDDLIEVEIDGKTLLMQKGISLGEYRPINSKFSKPLADMILQAITNGDSITKSCKDFGVGYATLMKWAESNEEFGKELDKARAYRAEMAHDKLVEMANELQTKEMSKTKVEAMGKAADILKWSAEKSSPNKYGNKQEKNGNGAVSIIIQTGITREPETIVSGEVIQIHPERIDQ